MPASRLSQFVGERQRIWWRRFVLRRPPPWTSDKALHTWRFTNIQRELDAGTVYLMDNLLGPWREETVFSVLLYRWLNNREAFDEAVQDLDRGFWGALRARRDRGDSIFTSAWTVSLGQRCKGRDPIDFIEEESERWRVGLDPILGSGDVVELYGAVRALSLFGDLIAWQATLDLIYLRDDLDDDTWIPRLYDGSKTGKHNPGGSASGALRVAPGAAPDSTVRSLRDSQDQWLPDDWPIIRWEGKPRLSLADVEHALCEYDKWERVNEGGKMKRRYRYA